MRRTRMRRMWTGLALTLALGLVAAGCTSEGGGGGDGGTAAPSEPAEITIWHGYTAVERDYLEGAAEDFMAEHPDVTVKVQFYGNADLALQKVLTAIAGDEAPDIAYLYGSWAANISKSPTTLDLNEFMANDPDFDFDDFWPAARLAATVDERVVGLPALIDNLALVYNKEMFDAAGLDYPTEDWTWDDFRDAAKALTDPEKKTFGWAYVADGSEDTVWRFDAALWGFGGDILAAGESEAAFNAEPGVETLSRIRDMTITDGSVYLDNGSGQYLNLFGSNKVGMLWTGPWDLPSMIEDRVDYGVTFLPRGTTTATVSGPDNWVLFDNGESRAQAAWEFVTFLTSPEQTLKEATATGHLPVRQSVTELAGYQEYVDAYPGIETFVANQANATKVRPVLASYPKISKAMGTAVQAVLLDGADPKQALDQAAQEVNAILAVPT